MAVNPYNPSMADRLWVSIPSVTILDRPTYTVAMSSLCPITGNPLAGSTLDVTLTHGPSGHTPEIVAVAGCIDATVQTLRTAQGAASVDSIEEAIGVIARDLAHCFTCAISIRANLQIATRYGTVRMAFCVYERVWA